MNDIPERIVIGSDHGGFDLKEAVKKQLLSLGYGVEDCSESDNRPVDYPIIGKMVVKKVLQDTSARGILICGTGLGMTILANKFPGIRACLCHDVYSARMSRAHNNANILTMGGRIIGVELAKEILSAWLQTSFEGGRHQRRLIQIEKIECNTIKGDSNG